MRKDTSHHLDECELLFKEFTFQPIREVDPPDRKGVYVIRILERGKDISEIIRQVDGVIQRLRWPVVTKRMGSRIRRLEKIGDCLCIYIGSAGTYAGSEHILKGRYKDFSRHHTAMFPLWSLLNFRWELEYGWLITEDPG